MSVVLAFGNADACGANVSMSVLVILMLGGVLVVIEFDANSVGL